MPEINHLVNIGRQPEVVFPLVAESRGFAQWWAEDVFEEIGDWASLGFFDRATVYRLHRGEVIPNERVIWNCESGTEWKDTRLVFELLARGNTTILRFCHAGWHEDSESFRMCNTTWGELMYRLKAAAEGKNRGPLFRAGDLAY